MVRAVSSSDNGMSEWCLVISNIISFLQMHSLASMKVTSGVFGFIARLTGSDESGIHKVYHK